MAPFIPLAPISSPQVRSPHGDINMARPSPIFKLPPELRNMIYDLVILSDTPLDVMTEYEPGLAWTCRQARSEIGVQFYTRSTFELQVTAETLPAVVKFLASPSAVALNNSVRELTVRWVSEERGFLDIRVQRDLAQALCTAGFGNDRISWEAVFKGASGRSRRLDELFWASGIRLAMNANELAMLFEHTLASDRD
ncbi:hypothetical protein LTR85_003488 [Meristemomyces frigidus]|nr:hypothetical protein LTR85_003488 [Meristemomyces frigidus]